MTAARLPQAVVVPATQVVGSWVWFTWFGVVVEWAVVRFVVALRGAMRSLANQGR